jgi:drug/metabolite transporter (DMT)-like permease
LKKNLSAHLAVLSANLIFSVNFSVVKFVTPSLIKPFGLNLLRVLVTTSLLWLLGGFAKHATKIQRNHILLFILCGITGVTINQLLFIKGLSITYSSHAALLMLCTPILITIIAFFMLKEKLPALRVVGLGVGIGGAILLISSKKSAGIGEHIVLGDIMIILNAISYAFYFVLAKPLMQTYTAINVMRWVFTFGTIFIIPFGWEEFIAIPWPDFSLMDYAAITFVVLAATFLAYYLNAFGLQQLDAAATGAYIYLQPVFATIFATIFLNERISANEVIAAILIFSGVYLVNRKYP